MSSPSWERVAEVFEAVVDLPPAEQAAQIAAAGDESLRRELRDLVRAARDSGEGGFLSETIAATAADLSAGPWRRRSGPDRTRGNADQR